MNPVMQVQVLLPEPLKLMRGRLTVGRSRSERSGVGSIPAPATLKTEVIRPDEEPVSKTGAVTPLWVRVPRLPLQNKQSRGPAATTPGSHPGNGGSSPSGTTCNNTSSQSSPECSPPCHGGDRRFKSDRGRLIARYANWQSGEAQTFAPVGSTPTRATSTCVGWALASLSGCNPPASGLCRFNSCPSHSHGPFV